MPVYRGVGVGRSMSPYDNVKGGGASLRQDDGGASLRQDDGDVSQRQNGGGVSLRTGNDTVDTQPPSRREYNSYTQPENRHFVSASLSSVDSDESIILVAGGFKRAQQPPRPVSTVSTDSGEDVLVYTPRRGHTRGRGSTIKAAVRPNAGLGGGASLKVDDDIPSPMTSSGAASSAYATSIEGRNGEEKKEVQMTPSLTTKPEPKPAQGSSPRLQPLVNSGETTTGALSAFPRSSLQHPLSTHNQQATQRVIAQPVHTNDIAATTPTLSTGTPNVAKKRQNRNRGKRGKNNTQQPQAVNGLAAVSSSGSTGHNQKATLDTPTTTAPSPVQQGVLSQGYPSTQQLQTVIDQSAVVGYSQTEQHASGGRPQMHQRRQTVVYSPEQIQTSSASQKVPKYIPPQKRCSMVSRHLEEQRTNEQQVADHSNTEARSPTQVALLSNLRRETIGASQFPGGTHHRGLSLPQNPLLYGGQSTIIAQNQQIGSLTQESAVAPGSFGQSPQVLSGVVGGYRVGMSGSLSDPNIGRYLAGQPTDISSSRSVVLYDPPAPMDGSSTMVLSQGGRSVQAVGPLHLSDPTEEEMKLRSNVLKALTERGRPSVADIFSNTFLPFIEASEFEFQTANAGVVHITNLPYEVTRQEVVALLVRTCNGKVLEERHEPVHIIMDRITGKTKDAYVEIRSHEDAMKLIENVEYKRNVEHRPPRLGSRVVNITLSSQAQLMKALFPDAQMEWYGAKGVPKRDSRFSHENFKGFFSDEEMTMLAKHTNPTHASFAKLCPERVYECMISTIRKVPWGMTDLITMAQRHLIYETALNMVATLNERLKDMDKRRQDPPPPPAAAAIAAAPSFSGNRHGAMQRGGRNGNGRGNYHGHGRNNSQLVPQHAQGVQQQRPGPGEPRDNRAPWEFFEGRLTVELRKRLVETCMMCPGFTVVQKDCFGAVAGMPHSQRYGFNLPFFSEGWTHLYALVPKVNMPADLLGYYIALIREETTRVKDSLPMSQRKVLEKKTTPIMEYFGYLWVELDLPRGPEFDNMTLRQIMKLEWDAIERVIRRALVGGIVGPQWLKDHDDD